MEVCYVAVTSSYLGWLKVFNNKIVLRQSSDQTYGIVEGEIYGVSLRRTWRDINSNNTGLLPVNKLDLFPQNIHIHIMNEKWKILQDSQAKYHITWIKGKIIFIEIIQC